MVEEGKEFRNNNEEVMKEGSRNHGPRRRKSGLVSRLKKFGSQGKLGRGYEINSETYNYFLKIFELCNKNEFENDEERSKGQLIILSLRDRNLWWGMRYHMRNDTLFWTDLFVDNAFIQTENEEVHLSSNQFTSRVLETLINLTKNEEILNRFTMSFTPALRTMCMDPYASHVVETLLQVISEKWMENKKLVKWFRNTSKYVFNNYEDFIFDKYANHIMRKAAQCLSNTVHLFSTKTQQHNASSTRLPLPPVITPISQDTESEIVMKFQKKNKKILREYARRLLEWPQFAGKIIQFSDSD